MLHFRIVIAISVLSFRQLAIASDSLSISKQRKLTLGVSSLAITTGSLLYLNQVWYQPYRTAKFHTFDDNAEWFQMDKFGHTLTTYQTARLMMQAMDWSGYSTKKQLLLGGLSGFAYMSAIEMMDGYSDGWGFSWGDMLANTIGSGIAISQHVFWSKQRIQLKFSYYTSGYATYRPDLLGKTFSEQILKDYNAQTYWLSVNPSLFFHKKTRFPEWLNIALGYGANGMLGARYNNLLIQDANGNTKYVNRYRQYYVSLDIDLTRIPTKSKFLKSLFSCVNIIKMPFPTLELSEGNIKFNYY